MFGSSNAFQNGMSGSGSMKNHRGDRLLGKGLDHVQDLLGGDWAVVLPTHKLIATSLVSQENFIEIDTVVQKLFNIFCSTDRHKDSIQNKALCTIYGNEWEFFSLWIFLPFHSLCELALVVLSVLFR